DIRTVMAEMGKAMMGTGEAEGDDRAVKAAEKAISNPLLDDASLRGARGVLINITGGYDMTLFEVDEAANRIRKEVDEDANIIFGSSVEEDLNGRLRVSVVATGIDAVQPQQAATPAAKPEGLTLVPGGRPATAAPARAASPVAAAPAPGPAPRRAAGIPGSFLRPAVNASPMLATEPAAPMLGPVPVLVEDPDAAPAMVMMTPAPAANSLPGGRPAPMVGPAEARAAAAPPAQSGGGFRNLFRNVTGGGLMRRSLPEPTPAPVADRLVPDNPAPRQATRAPQQDDMGLDIPTFLRRQSN
ncbi:MAG: cell division protein FtsZ, partial [Paracraurococcus sp.]